MLTFLNEFGQSQFELKLVLCQAWAKPWRTGGMDKILKASYGDRNQSELNRNAGNLQAGQKVQVGGFCLQITWKVPVLYSAVVKEAYL